MKYKLVGFDNKDREAMIKQVNDWFEKNDITIGFVHHYYKNDRKKWYSFIYYTEGNK
jgi:hypothetical protein